MPDVDGMAAHDTLLTYAPLSRHGYCLHYVWLAYAAHGATSAATYPTAYSAWEATRSRHYDRNPPPGKPIWLGRRFSDGNMSGDVFIAGRYDGDHAATDYPGWGDVGRCSIQERISQTGREYLGWTDDFLGNTITSGPTPPPAPTPDPVQEDEEDMPRNSAICTTANDQPVSADNPADYYAIVNTDSGYFSPVLGLNSTDATTLVRAFGIEADTPVAWVSKSTYERIENDCELVRLRK